MTYCTGKKCEAKNGRGHSAECMKEHSDTVNGVSEINTMRLLLESREQWTHFW